MKTSKIQWCRSTFNPWWGCVEVSDGCANCYARTFDKRVGGKNWGKNAGRRFFSEAHWNEPLVWERAAAATGEVWRVFCASMADVFEDNPILEGERARLFGMIEATPHLTWLLLTKRPENMVRLAPASWGGRWPANVIAMTSCENQATADARLHHLMRVPSRLHAVSAEPLLGPINFNRIGETEGGWFDALTGRFHLLATSIDGKSLIQMRDDFPEPRPRVDWIIIGGESGPKARPFDLAWAIDIIGQCRMDGVAPFFKQAGSKPIYGGTLGRLTDAKGGDLDELPPAVRIREFPR